MRILLKVCLGTAVVLVVSALFLPPLAQHPCGRLNDRNAASTLKTLAAAQADFRENDRDGDGERNYWRADVAALYGMIPKGTTDMIRLVDLSTACADAQPLKTPAKAAFEIRPPDDDGMRSAKAGYWYLAIPFENETPDRLSPDQFAICAAPDSPSAGKVVLGITQAGVVWSAPARGRKDFPRSFPRDPEKSGWKRFGP